MDRSDRRLIPPYPVPVPEGLVTKGTPSAATFLRGDGTWATLTSQLEVDNWIELGTSVNQTIPDSFGSTIVDLTEEQSGVGLDGITYAENPAGTYVFTERAGLYLVQGEVDWDHDVTGLRRVVVVAPSASAHCVVAAADLRNDTQPFGPFPMIFEAHDPPAETQGYLFLLVEQDSGGDLDVTYAQLRIARVVS